MTFSSSIIEEWLLTGKAQLRNLACGEAGLTQIPVPEGKTFIVTKIEILPFANIITDANLYSKSNTLTSKADQTFTGINQRIQYQLLFYNERINNTWNIRNKFSINGNYDAIADALYTTPQVIFEKQDINTFMVIESNSWIYLKYIDFNTNVPSLSQDSYTNIFIGSQNWNPSDFGYTDQDDIAEFVSSAGPAFSYVPQGYNTNYGNPALNSDKFTLVSNPTSLDPAQFTSFTPPFALGTTSTNPISPIFNNSLPLYNIEYIEVNRRLSTTGLL